MKISLTKTEEPVWHGYKSRMTMLAMILVILIIAKNYSIMNKMRIDTDSQK